MPSESDSDTKELRWKRNPCYSPPYQKKMKKKIKLSTTLNFMDEDDEGVDSTMKITSGEEYKTHTNYCKGIGFMNLVEEVEEEEHSKKRSMNIVSSASSSTGEESIDDEDTEDEQEDEDGEEMKTRIESDTDLQFLGSEFPSEIYMFFCPADNKFYKTLEEAKKVSTEHSNKNKNAAMQEGVEPKKKRAKTVRSSIYPSETYMFFCSSDNLFYKSLEEVKKATARFNKRNRMKKRHCVDVEVCSSSASPHSSCLSPLNDHNCLVYILDYLPWQDLNNFALVSKECSHIRAHSSLNQTRSGTITLNGKGVTNAIELLNLIRERQYPSKVFKGNRTHLRLHGLMNLSSYIEPINEDFIRDNVVPLSEVTSLDCSNPENSRRRPWLSPYRDYIDKGFAHGLAISLLAPNLRQIDMSYLPLTLLGVDWLLQNNPDLETIKWNRSVIWPITNEVGNHLRSCKNVKEMYLEDARMLFCDTDSWDQDALWRCLAENCQKLQKVSLKGAKFHLKLSTLLTPIPQDSLMKFVRCIGPNLRWFCSNLTQENIAILQQERPDVKFC